MLLRRCIQLQLQLCSNGGSLLQLAQQLSGEMLLVEAFRHSRLQYLYTTRHARRILFPTERWHHMRRWQQLSPLPSQLQGLL